MRVVLFHGKFIHLFKLLQIYLNVGGWTLIKRTKLRSSTPLDASKRTSATDYRDLSNYHFNNQLVSSPVLLQLKRDMGFDQMRFYCFKKSVGRVLHIMTKLNPEGEAVVNYFTASPAPARPNCANSFTRLPDDTSKVSRECGSNLKWTSWSSSDATGNMRVYYRVIVTSANYKVQLTPDFLCDENSAPSVDAGDTFEVFVR